MVGLMKGRCNELQQGQAQLRQEGLARVCGAQRRVWEQRYCLMLVGPTLSQASAVACIHVYAFALYAVHHTRTACRFLAIAWSLELLAWSCLARVYACEFTAWWWSSDLVSCGLQSMFCFLCAAWQSYGIVC